MIALYLLVTYKGIYNYIYIYFFNLYLYRCVTVMCCAEFYCSLWQYLMTWHQQGVSNGKRIAESGAIKTMQSLFLSFSLSLVCVCVCVCEPCCGFVAQENKKFKSSVVSWDKARALESMVPSNTKAFFVWSSSILSSIESFVIKRMAVTGFFWPRRWLLQMACISTAGFHPEREWVGEK